MSRIVVYILTILTSFNYVHRTGSCSSCCYDLLVNGRDNPPHIVVLEDLKPGDNREVTKDLYILCTSPSKIYLHIKDVVAAQGFQTEPETVEEQSTPKFDIHKYINYSLRLASSPIISPTDNISFTDAVSCWIPLGTIPPKTHVSLYQSFHFNSAVTNWAQGDKVTFTEEFVAQEATNPNPPVTSTGRIWNPTQKKCVPI